MLSYVQTRRGEATYLLATFGAQAASFYITATDGDAVLPVGGFNSADPTPTLEQFTGLVASGELRFVLVGRSGGGGQVGSAASAESTATQIQDWVRSNCAEVQGISGLYACSA